MDSDNRLVGDGVLGPARDVAELLLVATESAWTTAPPSEITMRRIADDAGVSVGVAYNYFESKEALFGSMLDRVAARLSARVESGSDGRAMLLSLWEAMDDNPAFQRLMTWLVLEQQNVSSIMSRHSVIADIAMNSENRQIVDPGLAGGMTAFLGISFQMYEVLVNRAMGRSPDDPALKEATTEMFGAWFEYQQTGGSDPST